MTSSAQQLIHTGENVICLHSSLSSSRQWQSLETRLQKSYRVTAVDLHGYGHGPLQSAGPVNSLASEVALLNDLFEQQQGPIHLVGHSYGAAVAIKLALAYPQSISSLTLYEPVIFAALFSHSPFQPATVEVSRLFEDIQASARAGNLMQATERFIDYWSGPGSWAAMPIGRQFSLAKQIPILLANFEAVVSEPNALADLANIQVPVHYLQGEESPASVHAIGNLLKLKLPQAVLHEFTGIGHMGPITHSEIVNEQIEGFIRQLSRVDSIRNQALAA